MPRTLFLKIFLWFGAVTITVIAGSILVGELMRPEPFGPPMRGALDRALDAYAKTAAETYEHDGSNSLAAYMDQMQQGARINAVLLDDQMQELAGRRLPTGAFELAQRVLQTRQAESDSAKPSPLIAKPAVSTNGRRYVLIAEMPAHVGPPPLHDQITHHLVLVVIGGIFCYGLARYLTAPVTKLRDATRELARGNLSARVMPALGNRRDELASLAADFDVMAEKIQSLVDSQRRLLGDISHELRSPLARLNVALELARQRSGTGATMALERIQREAEILNEMIGQLLALTRLESGTEEIRKTEFDVALLVREITDDADFEARSRKRSVRLKSVDSCTMVGNEQLLRRAIENVVRNGVQYTAEDTGVEVKLECSVKHYAGKLNNESPDQRPVVITVRDHGSGVPENALAEIFRPFYRVDDARDREAGGVGLGLAIAERAVQLHRGSVEATNASDGGLVVTITLPI